MTSMTAPIQSFICVAVFSQGDKGNSWYIIWKGSVNVITHGKVSCSCVFAPLTPEGLRECTCLFPTR